MEEALAVALAAIDAQWVSHVFWILRGLLRLGGVVDHDLSSHEAPTRLVVDQSIIVPDGDLVRVNAVVDSCSRVVIDVYFELVVSYVVEQDSRCRVHYLERCLSLEVGVVANYG